MAKSFWNPWMSIPLRFWFQAALTPQPGAIKKVEAGPRGEQMLGQADPWVADGSDISKVTGLAKQK